MTFKTFPRGSPSWDPFHEFFQWLATNNTDWCTTAANYYQVMLHDTKYCPGDGPISDSFCNDFVDAYVVKCVQEVTPTNDDKTLVAVFAVALTCALLSGWVGKRSTLLPESAVCIMVGVGAGILLYSTATTHNMNVQAIGFDASVFFLVLVPPIALQSLLEVHPKHFCRNFFSILWLAILNTILTCVTVGFILFYTVPDLGMPTCLLLGAISSSVDPTALRVSLEKRISHLQMSVDMNMSSQEWQAGEKEPEGQMTEEGRESREGGERINAAAQQEQEQEQEQEQAQEQEQEQKQGELKATLRRLLDVDATIFGESTLNDGVSFVLFTSLLPLVTSNMIPLPSPRGGSLSPSSLTPLERTAAECMAEFFYQYSTSFVLGLCAGIGSALTFKLFASSCALREKNSEKLAGRRGMVVFIALSLLPYFLCELYELSGLVGLCGSTFIMLNFTNHSLSPGQRHGVLEITRTWSKLTEFFIFSYLGFCIAAPLAPTSVSVSDVKFEFDAWLIAMTCLACLISRGWIILLGWSTNILRKNSAKFEFRGLIIMYWSGLRGPVCFALAMSVPRYNFVTGIGTTNAPKIAATMTSLVIFTVFVLGGTSNALIYFLYNNNNNNCCGTRGTTSRRSVESGDDNNNNNNDEIDSQRPLVALAMRTNRGCFQRYIAKLHRCAYSLLVHDVSIHVSEEGLEVPHE